MPADYKGTNIFKLGKTIYCADCGIPKRDCLTTKCCEADRHGMLYMIKEYSNREGRKAVLADPYVVEIKDQKGRTGERRLALFKVARLYPTVFPTVVPDHVSKHENFVGVPYLSRIENGMYCNRCGMPYHICILKNPECPRHDGAGAGPARP
jgi:hypothetical protein